MAPQRGGSRRQAAVAESVLLVDVILESSGKRQPRNAPQGGSNDNNHNCSKTFAIFRPIEINFLATIAFRHQFRVEGTFN